MGFKKSGRIRRLRESLIERENGRCFYCSVFVIWPEYKVHRPNDATIDHITPKSQGGIRTLENTVLACRECNEKRGTRDAGAFLIELRTRRPDDW